MNGGAKIIFGIIFALVFGLWGYAYTLSIQQAARSERLSVLEAQFNAHLATHTAALIEIRAALRELENQNRVFRGAR